MLRKILLISLLLASPLLQANGANSERNYTGVYACKGHNNKVGDYVFSLTLKANKANSHDEVDVYDVSGQTENATHYFGRALAMGNKMSLAFRISDYKENTFGVGLATFKYHPEKSWSFTTQYYEPGEEGGITGTEVCSFQATVATTTPVAPKKPAEKSAEEASPNPN
ncbi:MAG TPA: hypothetical protein VGD04_03640 [Methylophilus sp.]